MNLEEARKEAESKLDQRAMRSCWNCNPAHEHLKEAEYPFVCFECGNWFYKGFNITSNPDDPQPKLDEDVLNHKETSSKVEP
jgi:hypothetical protein